MMNYLLEQKNSHSTATAGCESKQLTVSHYSRTDSDAALLSRLNESRKQDPQDEGYYTFRTTTMNIGVNAACHCLE